MYAGEPALPVYVHGAKPPTAPSLHRPSPAPRKVQACTHMYIYEYVYIFRIHLLCMMYGRCR